MKKRKKNPTDLLLILIFFVGLSLLLYPSISDYWNTFHQTRVIQSYTKEVAELEEEQYDTIWNDAWEYNRSLLLRSTGFVLPEKQKAEYESLLNLSGQGIMGYLEIPKIEISLPIYHGTEESVLQVGIGHLDWSSLPVGGANSHCVLSGHRGLPSAKLLTNLDRMQIGDCFYLQVLDETLTYEVDQILIVEPEETAQLQIEEGKDYCTLVTCTPYGINTHRLLVRGTRVDTVPERAALRVTADAIQVDPALTALVLAIPVLLLLSLLVFLPKRRR